MGDHQPVSGPAWIWDTQHTTSRIAASGTASSVDSERGTSSTETGHLIRFESSGKPATNPLKTWESPASSCCHIVSAESEPGRELQSTPPLGGHHVASQGCQAIESDSYLDVFVDMIGDEVLFPTVDASNVAAAPLAASRTQRSVISATDETGHVSSSRQSVCVAPADKKSGHEAHRESALWAPLSPAASPPVVSPAMAAAKPLGALGHVTCARSEPKRCAPAPLGSLPIGSTKEGNRGLDAAASYLNDRQTSETTAKQNIADESQRSPCQKQAHNVSRFPGMIVNVLSKKENRSIVRWDPKYRAIIITDLKEFSDKILEAHFIKMRSFHRQLNYYGFEIHKAPALLRPCAKMFVNKDPSICQLSDIARLHRHKSRPNLHQHRTPHSPERWLQPGLKANTPPWLIASSATQVGRFQRNADHQPPPSLVAHSGPPSSGVYIVAYRSAYAPQLPPGGGPSQQSRRHPRLIIAADSSLPVFPSRDSIFRDAPPHSNDAFASAHPTFVHQNIAPELTSNFRMSKIGESTAEASC